MQLDNLGVSELSLDEMNEIDGGIWIAVAVGLIALAWSTAAN